MQTTVDGAIVGESAGNYAAAFKAFCDAISFRLVKPSTPVPAPAMFALINQLAGMAGFSFEYANTRIPGERGYKRGLRPLLRVARASTIAIGAMINRAVAAMPADQCFLNVGVWNGFTFFAGMLHNAKKRCVGVDNFCLGSKYAHKRGWDRLVHHYPRKLSVRWTQRSFITRFGDIRSPLHQFYYMDYQDYFRDNHRGTIGVYMYDAMHHYVDQVRGLALAEPFMAAGCIVFIDDTNGPDVRRATLDFVAQSGHSYNLIVDRPTRSNHHPTLWNGIMVLRKND